MELNKCIIILFANFIILCWIFVNFTNIPDQKTQ